MSLPVADDLGRALAVLRQHGRNSFSPCLLYDGVVRYWCRHTDGFVGYLAGRGIHVAIGEPVCAAADYAAAAREFSAFSRSVKADCLFAAVGQAFVDAVAGTEAMVVPIGDDLLFDVASYTPRGDRAKKIRSAVNQLAGRGGRAIEYRRGDARDPRLDAALESLVATWMQGGKKLHLHFMEVDLFRFVDLKRYFYVDLGGEVVGLLTCMPILARDGFLFEDVIRLPDAPAGVIEMTVLAALERFRAEGRKVATFGPSLRPRLEGCRNLTRFDRMITRLLVPLASRFGKLPNHYHARKKFGILEAEPLYLMMWPDDLTWTGLFHLLRLFHII